MTITHTHIYAHIIITAIFIFLKKQHKNVRKDFPKTKAIAVQASEASKVIYNHTFM